MQVLKRLVNKVLERLVKIIFSKPNHLAASIIGHINMIKPVVTSHGVINFSIANTQTLNRAASLLKKEPDTIAWIDSFNEEDVLYDIGANVGVFALYAAKRGVLTYAFEPESQNYASLCKNIYLNNFGHLITALNLALANNSKIDKLFLSQFGVGNALHNLGKNSDFNQKEFDSVFEQQVCVFSLDELIEKYALQKPTHIKIDVDGIESEVIEGAIKTLRSDSVKSVLIELNMGLENDQHILGMLEGFGFELASKYPKSVNKIEYKNIFNMIFTKKIFL